MSLSKVRELREQRAKLAEQMAGMAKTAADSGKPMSEEDRSKFNKIDADQESLKGQIDILERAAQAEAETRSSIKPPEDQPGAGTEKRDGKEQEAAIAGEPKYRALFRKDFKTLTPDQQHHRSFIDYCYNGLAGMSPDERAFYTPKRFDLKADSLRSMFSAGELRDMGIGTNTLGGYFVPQGFVYDIFEAQKFYGKMTEEAEVLDTATGNPMPYPTDNDTANAATVIGEATQVSEVDVSISHINLGAWMFTSNEVKVSLQLMQDSAFDMESYLRKKFAVRFGRGLNTYLTNGSGSNQPNGILTAVVANNGSPASGWTGYGIPVIANGSSTNTGGAETGGTSIGTTDLTDLESSVDPAYRLGAKYMAHDSTFRKLKELLDKYGRPLWRPGVAVAAPDTINGYPYVVNNDMPTIAVNAKTMIFGNLKTYLYRRVKELAVIRLNERYADYAQVAFLAFARGDGQLIDPGNHPVNYLVQAAS